MTTETTTLTDWLLEQIAEDEAVARAAIDAPRKVYPYWRPGKDAGIVVDGMLIDDGVWIAGGDTGTRVEGAGMTIYEEGGHTEEQAVHIARHDPARVLATCSAHRAIVEEHGLHDPDYPELHMCAVCYDYAGVDAAPWPCPTLRALASIYADREGYRELAASLDDDDYRMNRATTRRYSARTDG